MEMLVVLIVSGAGVDPAAKPMSLEVFGEKLHSQMSVDIIEKLKQQKKSERALVDG